MTYVSVDSRAVCWSVCHVLPVPGTCSDNKILVGIPRHVRSESPVHHCTVFNRVAMSHSQLKSTSKLQVLPVENKSQSQSQLLPTSSFLSVSSAEYGSIQNTPLNDADAFVSKRTLLQRCYDLSTWLFKQVKTALRFEDDELEAKFVQEQYRTPCFMRLATIFGVIQIIIAPSLYYGLILFNSQESVSSSVLLKLVFVYITLCWAGGFVLILFSRLSKTHHWWTAVGISSNMLIFCGYYLFNYLSFLTTNGFYYGEQQPTQLHVCNETMFHASQNLMDKLFDFSNQSAVDRYDFGSAAECMLA